MSGRVLFLPLEVGTSWEQESLGRFSGTLEILGPHPDSATDWLCDLKRTQFPLWALIFLM